MVVIASTEKPFIRFSPLLSRLTASRLDAAGEIASVVQRLAS